MAIKYLSIQCIHDFYKAISPIPANDLRSKVKSGEVFLYDSKSSLMIWFQLETKSRMLFFLIFPE